MNQPFGSGPAPGLPPAIDGELRLDDPAVDRTFRWLLREGRDREVVELVEAAKAATPAPAAS